MGAGLVRRRIGHAGVFLREAVGEHIGLDLLAADVGEHVAVDLDGNVEWNPARLLNHSCVPNCEADCDGKSIWIVALRDLAAGEELTFNYGYELADYRDSPCLCGTTTCVGYIVAEEYFEQVRLETTVRA